MRTHVCTHAEPTNHLDIPSKEMLEEAIQAFGGSVIAVSHDRYFLRKIATRILQVGAAARFGARGAKVLCALHTFVTGRGVAGGMVSRAALLQPWPSVL